jgi:4-nitrophenyl phosphatase
MNGLRQALEAAGLMPIAMDDAAEAQRRVRAAVMGLDRAVTYPKLAWFCRHVERLGAYVLTNGDLRVPMEDGFVPGNGAIGKLVTATTGIEPYVAGKPNKAFVRFALQRFGASEAEAVLVGDNLATDIAAGRAAGVYTIWVGTGVTAAPAGVDQTGVVTPDARCDSVADLFR